MKIIAKVDEEKYFVEITSDEIAIMFGYDSKWDMNSEPEVGQEIPTDKMVWAVRNLRGFDENRIKSILKSLEQATKTVETIQEATRALTLFDKIKGDGERV